MKRKLLIIALVISAFLFGRFGNMNTIDMNRVTNIQGDAKGAQITLVDGSGYYWER
uniref:hypothetical protein n=1 Tax=Clostridium sp. 12(A) TaxID=1163671 RepID=UPI0012DF92AB|nr:hypothetical protein [Clostridium sp. 12(A)]